MASMDAPLDEPWSLRALLAWPLGSAVIALVEVSQQASHQSPSASAWVLAGCLGFAVGQWLGALWCLSLRLWRGRRGTRMWRPPGPATLTGLLAACLVAVPVYFGAAAVLQVSRANPVDFDATALRLWRAGLLVAAPGFALTFYVALRWSERHVARRPTLVLGMVALTWVWVLSHMCSGPFFLYFPDSAAWALWGATAAALAPFLPPAFPRWSGASGRSRLRVVGLAMGLGALPILGLVGLRHDATRALLLHENRVFPSLHRLALGRFDEDGDGDLPQWLGGNDCDDGDPTRAGYLVDRPDTDDDENCYRGPVSPLPAPGPARTSPRRPPIFLITIDTVRADRLELYGAARETMPALTRLARGGRWFERAYAPANHTFFSITALLAGQSCERMLVPPPSSPVGPVRFTFWLPDQLRRLGYRNVAFRPPLVGAGMLRPEDLKFDVLDLGPDDFGSKHRGTTSKQVVNSVLDFLRRDEHEAPLFAWIHLMDPHAVHEGHVRFDGGTLEDSYDNELSWVDYNLARLFDEIETRFGGEALIVVTSDHGEELGEHRNYGHGFTLREEEIRVPLVIHGPGIVPGVERAPVSTLGVVPTLLEYLGVPAPADTLSYTSLLGDEHPDPVVHTPSFLWNERRMEAAIIKGTWKLIHSRSTNTSLLFNLEHDPEERFNRIGEDIPDAATLDDLRGALEALR